MKKIFCFIFSLLVVFSFFFLSPTKVLASCMGVSATFTATNWPSGNTLNVSCAGDNPPGPSNCVGESTWVSPGESVNFSSCSCLADNCVHIGSLPAGCNLDQGLACGSNGNTITGNISVSCPASTCQESWGVCNSCNCGHPGECETHTKTDCTTECVWDPNKCTPPVTIGGNVQTSDSNNLPGVSINQGQTNPSGCVIGVSNPTDSSGNYRYNNIAYNFGPYCLRPPDISGYSRPPQPWYESLTATATKTDYNFTYGCPTPPASVSISDPSGSSPYPSSTTAVTFTWPDSTVVPQRYNIRVVDTTDPANNITYPYDIVTSPYNISNAAAGKTIFQPGHSYSWWIDAHSDYCNAKNKSSTFSIASAVSQVIPTVTTDAANPVAQTSATLNGNVTANGGASITNYGFLLKLASEANDCTLTNTTGCTPVISLGSRTDPGTGVFSSNKTGLAAGTAYKYKAYATNSVGTGYGPSWVDFSTTAPFFDYTVSSPGNSSLIKGSTDPGKTITVSNSSSATPESITLSVVDSSNNPINPGGATASFTNNPCTPNTGTPPSCSPSPVLTFDTSSATPGTYSNLKIKGISTTTSTVRYSSTFALTITAPTLPDLTTINLAKSISAPQVGDLVTFSGNVRNNASVATGATSFNNRYCIDNTTCLTTTTGRVGGDTTLSNLGATTNSATITSSAWTATLGSHTIYWCADAGNANGVIAESDENNNCTNLAFTVVAAGSPCPTTTEGYSCSSSSPSTTLCSVQSGYTCSTGQCYFCQPPTPPTVSTVNVANNCIDPGYIGNGVVISWNPTQNPGVNWVDVDTGSFTGTYYHSNGLTCSGTSCSITAPRDNSGNLFGAFPSGGTLSLNPIPTTYNVRTYNSTANFHSQLTNFSIPACTAPACTGTISNLTFTPNPVANPNSTTLSASGITCTGSSSTTVTVTSNCSQITTTTCIYNSTGLVSCTITPATVAASTTCTVTASTPSNGNTSSPVTVNPPSSNPAPSYCPWIQTAGGDVHSNTGITTNNCAP